MDDLISRKAAVELIRDTASGYTVSMFATSDECFAARLVATNLAVDINSMPSIEAEPVRHGKWERERCNLYCSACGKGYRISNGGPNIMAFKRCPECGAKMDLEG